MKRRTHKRLWIKATGKPLTIRWVLLPGLDLVVFRLGGRLDVYYTLGEDEKEWVLRASNREEMVLSRERWGFAFTVGEA
jgi:hypothetical protein